MAADLTRVAALPGQGGGIASHPRLEELRKPGPLRTVVRGYVVSSAENVERCELRWTTLENGHVVPVPLLVDRRAVLARAKALAALDHIETLLPERPTLRAYADQVLGWRLTPAAHVVRMLHTAPTVQPVALGQRCEFSEYLLPLLPRHFASGIAGRFSC